LRDRGVILAVCSKNEVGVAAEVFHKHPEMVLQYSDFAVFMANWNDKAENLNEIARQLNIGLDSLVFVDDNPVERARVRQALAEVAVPELPDDPGGYARCLADAGYFESVSFTADDQRRHEQYAANAVRESLRSSSTDLESFLKGLEMTVEVGAFAQVDLTRIAQLINKTNQFNPTTRRYTLDQVTEFAGTPGNITLQFRLRDRFGDNGLVSAMIIVPDPELSEGMLIDTWVMSCRVFGRQLEFEAMNVERAMRAGIRQLRAEYIPTSRNMPVAGLFPQLGFLPQPGTVSSNGKSHWVLKMQEYVTTRTHMTRQEPNRD
jgi:FkbH-like protein